MVNTFFLSLNIELFINIVYKMEIDIDLEQTDEDYVIEKAKKNFKNDAVAGKAWMLTAKLLYTNNFSVQFEAYLIEKNAGNAKEAAKCFSDLFETFQQQPELLKEIENVTAALRAESDTEDAEKRFLCEMFHHISSAVQHKLLLFTADHCEDTMEHCRLLLLLLQRFPTAISSNGPRLVDTLISAEKHSVDDHFPVNPYRKLLVCDLLPLLATDGVQVELAPKMLYKLLHKALEFYVCYLGLSQTVVPDNEPKIESAWSKLFALVEFIGKQLNWDPNLTNFTINWSKDSYWQRIISYCQSKQVSTSEDKQLLFCLSIFFLCSLYQYNSSLSPDSRPGQVPTTYIMVEAFTDPSLPSPVPETKSKKRKIECDTVSSSIPYITVEKPELKCIQGNFMMCVNCWDLLNSSENLQREFIKLNTHLKLDPLLSGFVIDYALYKGLHDEAFMFLQKITDRNLLLMRNLRIASILYHRKNYASCLDPILSVIELLPTTNVGSLSTNLIVGGNQKHLHYLPITRMAALQYIVKILLRCIKENMTKISFNELAIGHIFTLVQLDWPQEDEFIPPLLEQIQQHRSFQYHSFQNYIINVDILEELAYLGTSQGGQIQLDILPHLGQRRMGTRGADKGVKEEIKQAIRRQVARSNEKVDELIIGFIVNERQLILQVLM